MLSPEARIILSLLKTKGAMDCQDIEEQTGLSEAEIKRAAVELRHQAFVKTSGAPDISEANGMAIDRLAIAAAGKRAR